MIIPTHQRPVSLRKVLDHLARQTYPTKDFEVLVVLDGPDPRAEEILQSASYDLTLRWFTQPWRGATSARNLGVREARGELLAFLDDDILPGPDWLAAHVRAHEKRRVVFGGFRLAPDSPSRLIGEATDWSASHLERCARSGYEPGPADLPDGNFSVLKGNLVQAGGWDEAFTGFGGQDDQELALRLLRSGLQLYFEPAALASHWFMKSWADMLADQQLTGQADLYLLSKHPEYVTRVAFTGWAARNWWRRTFLQMTRRLPAFCMSAVAAAAPRSERWNPRRGRTILRSAARLTASLFYLRGFWEVPESGETICSSLRQEVPILCYHRVVPEDQRNSIWTLGMGEFERSIRCLAEAGYRSVSLGELRDWQKRLTPLPAKPVVITFDDGQEGFIRHAALVLGKHGYRATIFLIAGKLGKEVGLGGAPFRVMNHEEVRALVKMGFEIEGHGVTHEDWTRAGASTVRGEVTGSARIIAELTGRPARFFAYPYGKWTRSVRDLLETAGFEGACTTDPGLNGFHQDPFLLRRRLVLPASGAGVWARVGQPRTEHLPPRHLGLRGWTPAGPLSQGQAEQGICLVFSLRS